MNPIITDQQTQFSKLLPTRDWLSLPPAIRRRFASPLKPNESALYHGHVIETKISAIGLIIAHCARFFGSPLPFERGATKVATVRVTASANKSGQCWTRLYERQGKFPHVSHSFKRFAGKTGLEEYMGYGLGIGLKMHVEESALVFQSAFYFIQFLGQKITIPSAFFIGTIKLIHKEKTPTSFSITFQLKHPLFGLLIHQKIFFHDYSGLQPVDAHTQI